MKSLRPFPSAVAAVAFGLVFSGCGKSAAGGEATLPSLPSEGVVRYTYEVVQTWPHARDAFTQGLLFYQGSLLESTGLNGRSTLREVEWASGKVLKQLSLPREFFAEGLTVIGSKAYQVTWTNHKGFVYDADTFQRLGEFTYEGEGWGLTTDGTHLILSDGSSRIRFLDPATFAVVRTLDVRQEGRPVERLNELEYVNGEILANVWQTDLVVRIDAKSGQVRGVIDFAGLLSPGERDARTDVLNGIAYESSNGRLVVTGKFWPKLFEVRIKPAVLRR